MKLKQSILYIFILFQLSLYGQDETNIVYKEDGYFITDKMLSENRFDDKFFPDPTSIFKNKSASEIIFIQLYTDYFRPTTFHFYCDDVPQEVIDYYQKHLEINNININVKNRIDTLIQKASQIDDKFFTTKRGIKLGISQSIAEKKYGEPTKKIIEDNDTIEIWDYYGLYSRDIKKEIIQELIKMDKYGHTIEIHFRKNRAYLIHIENLIP